MKMRFYTAPVLIVTLVLCVVIMACTGLSFYWRYRITQQTQENAILKQIITVVRTDGVTPHISRSRAVDTAQLTQWASTQHFIYHQDRDIHNLQIPQPTSFYDLFMHLAQLIDDAHCFRIQTLQLTRHTGNMVSGKITLKEKKACHA